MVDYNKVIESAAGGNLQSLVTKLASLTLNEISELKAISGNIDWLKEELEILHAVLLDLSNEEVPSHQQKVWKNRVRELSYDMEDAIDEFELAAKNSSAIHEAGTSSFIDRAVQSVQSCIERIKRLPSDYVINQKIQSLKSRVDLSEERHKRLKTGRETEGTSNDAIAIQDLARYAHRADLVGIDAPRDDIIGMLDKGERRMVVAIVGFGGLGKTTLAKQVSDKIIADAGGGSFTSTAFVTVSRNPDIKKILIDIIVDFKLTDKPGDLQLDRRQLIDKLREYTKEKRYLVVVDDVWSIDAWKFIEAALYDNNQGSRIIVTTRRNDVAKECRRSNNGDVYRLKPLGDVEAEQLFIAKAFPQQRCPPNLDEIFREVLKKCGRSPLAILTLSGMLANKKTREQWEWVLDSLSYAAEEEDSDVSLMRKILSFSYFDLPQHLRTCLLYMSVFPEDAVIKRKRLVHRWIAQGFISTEGRSKTETGEHYFNELISRCLIQPVNVKHDGRVGACKVHDTILDFIKHKSIEENFVAFLGDAEEGSHKNKARHLSIQDYLENFTGLAEAERARSLTASGLTDKMVFYDSFSRLTCLRVLDLKDFHTFYRMEHHDTVINVSRLFHLKYFATGRIFAKSMEGFINLQYLETLDLRLCILMEFPRDIYELQHLIRLFVDTSHHILPSGIGKMKALEELKHINVEHSSLEFLQELGFLAKLRSVSLYLVEDTERDQQKDLVLTNSLRKLGMDGRNYLKSLTLSALGDFDFVIVDLDNFNGLSWREALLNIRELKMVGLRLTKVPGWMGTLTHLENLQLWLEDMGQEDLDRLAELRRLLYLVLDFDDYPAEGLTFGGTTTFQCLKYLRIPCHTWWTKLAFGSLPWLQHLGIELKFYKPEPESDSDDEEFPPSGFVFDIGHLHSLTRVDAYIFRRSMSYKDEPEVATKIIRDAVNALPNKPKLEIYDL